MKLIYAFHAGFEVFRADCLAIVQVGNLHYFFAVKLIFSLFQGQVNLGNFEPLLICAVFADRPRYAKPKTAYGFAAAIPGINLSYRIFIKPIYNLDLLNCNLYIS
jgi:hypothetical protein